jgi:tetratricopeptide (TPR) repeat protein
MNKAGLITKTGKDWTLSLGRFFMTACLLLALSSCGGKQTFVSPGHMNAAELNHRAETAFMTGDYDKSLDLYREALRVNRSMEDTDGIAVSLINIAAAYRKSGDTDNASLTLDSLLEDRTLSYPPNRLSFAAFLKAMLFMDANSYGKASEWADKARSFCGQGACPLNGKLYNLRARIALASKDFASAVTLGTEGLRFNRDLDDRMETANSLRIISEAKAAVGNYKEAGDMLAEALALDKTMGKGTGVHADLMGLGRLALMKGDRTSALVLFRRALAVSEASRDAEGAAEALKMIGQCSTDSEKR